MAKGEPLLSACRRRDPTAGHRRVDLFRTRLTCVSVVPFGASTEGGVDRSNRWNAGCIVAAVAASLHGAAALHAETISTAGARLACRSARASAGDRRLCAARNRSNRRTMGPRSGWACRDAVRRQSTLSADRRPCRSSAIARNQAGGSLERGISRKLVKCGGARRIRVSSWARARQHVGRGSMLARRTAQLPRNCARTCN